MKTFCQLQLLLSLTLFLSFTLKAQECVLNNVTIDGEFAPEYAAIITRPLLLDGQLLTLNPHPDSVDIHLWNYSDKAPTLNRSIFIPGVRGTEFYLSSGESTVQGNTLIANAASALLNFNSLNISAPQFIYGQGNNFKGNIAIDENLKKAWALNFNGSLQRFDLTNKTSTVVEEFGGNHFNGILNLSDSSLMAMSEFPSIEEQDKIAENSSLMTSQKLILVRKDASLGPSLRYNINGGIKTPIVEIPNQRLAFITWNNHLVIFDLKSRAEVKRIKLSILNKPAFIESPLFIGNETLAISSREGLLYLVNLNAPTSFLKVKLSHYAPNLLRANLGRPAFLFDHTFVFNGSGGLKIINKKGELVTGLDNLGVYNFGPTLLPDGRLAITETDGRQAKIKFLKITTSGQCSH